jgi:hypothetical protein
MSETKTVRFGIGTTTSSIAAAHLPRAGQLWSLFSSSFMSFSPEN